MQCKLKEILVAIPALSKLARSDLTLIYAYKLQKVLSALQKEADFFAQKRRSILDKYNEQSEEAERKTQAELDELLSLEVSPETAPVSIPTTENIKLTPNDIGVLLPFVSFEEI